MLACRFARVFPQICRPGGDLSQWHGNGLWVASGDERYFANIRFFIPSTVEAHACLNPHICFEYNLENTSIRRTAGPLFGAQRFGFHPTTSNTTKNAMRKKLKNVFLLCFKNFSGKCWNISDMNLKILKAAVKEENGGNWSKHLWEKWLGRRHAKGGRGVCRGPLSTSTSRTPPPSS